MISVDEALKMVLDRARTNPPIQRKPSECLGCVLAEDVVASVDSPPHDKALMDGYAVRSGDLSKPGIELSVLEQLTAGQLPSHPVRSGTATRIMTGAPIPEGADAVVMVERTEMVGSGNHATSVCIHDTSVTPGQNIMRRGESMRRGDTVLRAGHALRGIELGLLAELGMQNLRVFPQPSVAVLATGNELVPCDVQPQAGQIRNSNGPMLMSLVTEAAGKPQDLGIASDKEDDLSRLIRRGLDHDILLLSGGVSAGVLDLVPQVMKQLGVQEVFHKVRLKPGKPIWFGIASRSISSEGNASGGQAKDTLVFGLPGNPVSSLVCYLLFVRPALTRIAGRSVEAIQRVPAVLGTDWNPRSDRPVFYPGRAREENGELLVEPLKWRGSSDLRTLVDANVLIYFPGGDGTLRARDKVTVYLL